MANRVSVEISANVQGYVQGIDQATESTERYETETRKISDATVNLNKELRNAKREVQGLAAGYERLSKEEKQSQFGIEMKRQLDAAKEAAAQYIDMQADLQQELKSLASDTRALDVLTDATGILGDVTSATMGIIAQFTGREEDARRAVVAFTTAQSAVSAATKIQNALQKQSNIMLGVAKVQNLAAAAAEKAKASSTVGATVAQKAFNAVAKANPYVLLTTAVIALTAAIGGFILMTSKATTAQERLQKMMHEVSLEGQKDAQAEVVKMELLYRATQNTSLALKDRKEAIKKLKDEYPEYFKNMKDEEILLGKASEKYQQLKKDIIDVAVAKAYEKKLTSLAEQNVELDEQIEKQKKLIKEREKAAKQNNGTVVPGMTSSGAKAGEAWNISAAKSKLEDLENQQKENAAAQDKLVNKILETSAAANKLSKDTSKAAKTGGSKEVKAAIGSIEALEKEITNLQTLAKKGLLPAELRDPVVYAAKMKELQDTLKELKIKWGFDDPVTKLQELQEQLAIAKKQFILAVDTDDKEARLAALKAYYTAQKELEDYKLKIQIEPAYDEAKAAQEKKNINAIVQNAFSVETESYKFDSLNGETRKMADFMLKQFERVGEARKKLTEIMQSDTASDTQISAAQEGIDELTASYNILENTLNSLQVNNDILKTQNESFEKMKKNIQDVGSAVQATGELFSALGDVADDDSLKVMGIVAKAVATVALSYANALNSASSNWITWLAFGISGLATMLSMISSIKQATAGGFAEGGVIGGHSYTGDKLLARVNSGELVLNQKQQKSLLNQLDSNKIDNVGSNKIEITGKIRGTDILLVSKNTNRILGKTGNSISF